MKNKMGLLRSVLVLFVLLAVVIVALMTGATRALFSDSESVRARVQAGVWETPTPTTATADLALVDPPWCYPDDCNLLADDYPDVTAQVTFAVCGDTFSGLFVASGMLPSFEYQLKLEGRPSCKYADGDDVTNMNLGSIGRWWDDTAGANIPDGQVAAAIDAGHCVVGYVLFACATSDGSGDLGQDFNLDYSWHVCGTPERGAVQMPDGVYEANFVITENPKWWRTVLMADDIRFTVGHTDEDGDGVIDVCVP